MTVFPNEPYSDVTDYLDSYAMQVGAAFATVDRDQVRRAIGCLEEATDRNARIFVCGNGGSAAISNHFVCDHMKGAGAGTDFHAKVESLSTNMEIVSAIANDIDYSQVFAFQLSCLASPGDVLVAISSSGGSPNILAALNWARTHKLVSIAMVGFGGGEARSLADVCLHVKAENYGVVEDVHQSLMHILAQFLRQKRLVDRTQIGTIKF